MLDRLERKLGRFAIPNLVLFLVAGQVGSWILSKTERGAEFLVAIELVPQLVLRGEVWRLVSFLFVRPPPDLLFGDLGVIFFLMLTFIYGRALEDTWGAFKFNAYLFVGWLATVIASFFAGASVIMVFGVGSNLFLMESLMFAFAYLYPDYELRLFFILPVKIKWIALFFGAQMIYSAYQMVTLGVWQGTLLIGASVVNFFLFFGKDIVLRLRGRTRRVQRRRAAEKSATEPLHECAVCGKTDVDDPTLQFRYCSKCDGKRGYCMEHIRDHEHVRD